MIGINRVKKVGISLYYACDQGPWAHLHTQQGGWGTALNVLQTHQLPSSSRHVSVSLTRSSNMTEAHVHVWVREVRL